MGVADKEWKEKYLDSLEVLEQKERLWQQVESTLRRCISRISLIGDGRDPELDRRLERLRNQVRGEKDMQRLQNMVDAIIQHAEQVQASACDGAALSRFLLEILDQLSLSRALKLRAGPLRRRLKQGAPDGETLTIWKELVLEAFAETQGGETKNKGGLLGRILGGGPGEAEADGDAEEGAQEAPFTAAGFLCLLSRQAAVGSELLPRLEQICRQAGTAASREAMDALAKELLALLQPGQENPALPAHDVLNQLLERLDLPSELRPRMDALRNRLQQGLQPADLPPVLNELVDLVGQVRSHAEQERQEVERFLLQLTEQLTNLDREIEGVGQQGIDILEGSRRFGEAVDADVSDMHASVASATDLDELKQVIALRLQEIQERLREHREDEQNKNRKLEQSISLLQGRIREMEQESSTLRNEVAAARVEAFTDALTRLNNRLAYNSRMDHEYRRWKRYPFEMSLILLDVDHFKRVNDNFGHHAGDKVLKVFGSLLNHMTRETDFAARYGGEEFIVLLPETDLAGARAVAEKIRQSIESKAFHSGDQRVRITASCGVARFHEGDTPESVFKRCDDALYLAKNQGRNRCCTEDEL